jgi:hypothetical protein
MNGVVGCQCQLSVGFENKAYAAHLLFLSRLSLERKLGWRSRATILEARFVFWDQESSN